MLNTVEGVYRNGRIELAEIPTNVTEARVIVTFLPVPEIQTTTVSPAASRLRQPGSAQGRLVVLAEDDEHLLDFQEYMPS